MNLELSTYSAYKGKRVFITGHSGFKGSWLTQWLTRMGAEVVGYSHKIENDSHYSYLNLNVESIIADVRDAEKVLKAIQTFKPDIVFHLAAQPLVRESYIDPAGTYSTNIMGLVNVFEACRKTENVRAIVNITSDKCYENKSVVTGYKETDAFGGADPYSSSKGCAELITNSYRASFFSSTKKSVGGGKLLASARAGNVIGGGDWAKDRIIPDMIRAWQINKNLLIRYPKATRPWQHVLEPVYGYLLLGEKLLAGKAEFAEGWNFGPAINNCINVESLLGLFKKQISDLQIDVQPADLHEASYLMLDSTKAREKLEWVPQLDIDTTVGWTYDWYKTFSLDKSIITNDQISQYEKIILK